MDVAADLCPVGQGFRGAWVNRRRMAEKAVPQGTGSIIDDLPPPMVDGDCPSPCALAGVFVVAGFACRDGRRTSPPTCALWARVFAGPG